MNNPRNDQADHQRQLDAVTQAQTNPADRSNVPDSDVARRDRYAEAMFLSEEDYVNPEDRETVRQQIDGAMAVADEELAGLRAEVGRLGLLLETAEGDRDTFDSGRLDAKAELRALREGIRALADEWRSNGSGYGIPAPSWTYVADKLALLVPSPAATTGEAGLCRSCGFAEDCHGKSGEWCLGFEPRQENWPAPVSSGEVRPPSTYDELREAGWKTPDDIAMAREEGRAAIRAQVAALRDEWLPMVDGRSGSYLNPRIVTHRLAAIAAPVSSGDGCDCTALCSMGPTCPGGMLARLPGSGCARSSGEAGTGEACSTCGHPMDSPGCSLSPGRAGGFHTISGGVAKAAAPVVAPSDEGSE